MTHNIAVVGSGICGMSAALSLAQRGHRVTLFERDGPPPPGDADAAFFAWQRNGAAQFRHPHAFLGLLCNLLEQHYPELLADFYAAGARRVGFLEMLPAALRAGYVAAPEDQSLWVLMCRRATIETVMRRHVAKQAQVEIANHVRVTGLLADSSAKPAAVHGLQLNRDGRPFSHAADIVVDASGRLSKFPRWLAALGHPVDEDKADAEIVYFTRHYRLLPGESEPPRGERAGAGDLGYLKFGVFPGDGGHFAIILCVPVAELALKRAVRNGNQFDSICRNIPGLEPWLADGRAEATTEPFGIGDIHSVWRHYVSNEAPVAVNFFAIGDAAVRTNPLYGRGCSMGVLHANVLAETLDEIADPVQRAREFAHRSHSALRPIFDTSLREDQRGIRRALASMQDRLLQPPDSLRQWLGLAVRDALGAAAREQLHVARGAFRSFHLLEPPGAFLKHWDVRLTVLRYMLRGRKRNAAKRLQPGPTRREMLNILGMPTHLPGSDNSDCTLPGK